MNAYQCLLPRQTLRSDRVGPKSALLDECLAKPQATDDGDRLHTTSSSQQSSNNIFQAIMTTSFLLFLLVSFDTFDILST